jgi:hypothetical protein
MAAVTHRVSFNSTSNTTSYTSGSFTPGNGELLVCGVVGTGTVAATPTLSDSLGGTWTLVGSGTWSSAANSMYLFVRDALIGTGASMTVTFDCTADPSTGVTIEVAGVSGMSRAGASAALQAVASSGALNTTPATTFGAAAQTGNPTLVFLGNKTSPAGVTAPTGWTQQDNSGIASNPTTGCEYVSRDSGFTGTTITWGSTSTIWGAVAVELDTSAAGTTVAPGLGQLTLTGFAPTVLTPNTVPAGLGQLTLTGFAPTVLTPRLVTPGVGQLILTGFAPTVNITSGAGASPGTGQLVLTGFAPTVLTPRTVLPGLGQLTLTGFAPTVLTPRTVTPGVGQLTLTGFAPTVLTPRTVTPGVGQLVLTGFAPTVLTPRLVTPGVGGLTLTGFAPTVIIGNSVVVQAGKADLTLTGFAPTVIVSGQQAPAAGGFMRILYTDEARRKPRRKRRPEEEELIEAEPLKGPPELPAPVSRDTRPLTGLPRRAAPPVVVVLDEDVDEEDLMVLMHLLAEL